MINNFMKKMTAKKINKSQNVHTNEAHFVALYV